MSMRSAASVSHERALSVVPRAARITRGPDCELADLLMSILLVRAGAELPRSSAFLFQFHSHAGRRG